MLEDNFQQPSVHISQTQPIRVSTPSKKSSWKKILLAIVSAFVTSGVIVGVALLTFHQIGAVLTVKMKFPKSEFPVVYKVPQLRNIVTEVSTAQGSQEVTSEGFKFRVTWENKPRVKEEGNIKFLIFSVSENQALIFDKGVEEVLNDLPPYNNNEEFKKIKLFYGDKQLDSRYSFYKLILESNPDELHILLPKKKAIADSLLVIYKAVLAVPIEGGIYNFKTDSIKGFQFGDPNVSNGVEIHFFDKQDSSHMIGVRGATQEEIDFLINSIKTN